MSVRDRDRGSLLRAAFDVWADAVLVFDRDRTVAFANPAARRLFADDIEGLSPGRRAGRWTFRDAAGRLIPTEASPSARALRGEAVEDMRCELVSRDGTRRHVSVDAYPLRDEQGLVEGALCVLRAADAPADRPRPRLFDGQAPWLARAVAQGSSDERIRLLVDVGRALGASLDYEVTLETLAGAVVPAVADWCVVRIVEEGGRVRRLRTAYADRRHAPVAQAIDEYFATSTDPEADRSTAGVGRVLRTGEPVFVPQVSADWLRSVALDDRHLELLTQIGAVSVMHVPMLLRDRVVGVVTLVRTRPGTRYGAADLVLAEELCDRAAVAIENARLFEASERRGREAQAMVDIARVLAEQRDPVLVWQRVAAGVRTVLGDAPLAALYTVDPSSGDARVVAVSTEVGVQFDWAEGLPAGAGLVGVAIRRRTIVATEDAPTDPRVVYPAELRERLERSTYRALAVAPLVVQERVLGAIAVGGLRGRRFTGRELELLAAFADQAAVALDNARSFAEAEQRRVEAERARAAAEEANRSKDEFLAVLSHELRTPLTVILGWAPLLRRGGLNPAVVTEALAAIERNTRQQARLIDDLLDVSRIVTGKLECERVPVNLAAVVTDVVASARQDPRTAAVLAEPRIDEDVVTVIGDRVRLHQVVANLVSNALKFTPADGRVDVRLRRADGDVELVVSDTGKGLSPEELPRIFDRFYQVDRAVTRRHGGLGLGLAIVGHLVELHGGRVWAESAGLGRGARFTVRLPGAGAEQGRRRPVETRASSADERPLRGLRVLFVDDSADARALVAAVLTSAGADVVLAESAAEALALVEVDPFDVVLSDIGMPDADGFDLMRGLQGRERDRRRAPVPVIAVTAYADADTRARTLAAGFQRHLAKPIDPVELVRAVRDAAAGHDAAEPAVRPA